MRILALPLAILLTVTSVPLPAQQPPANVHPDAAAQADPIFKSSSNLVVFDVTVRDKSGKEVQNLKKEDFTLLEDGKPQPISVFELQKLSSEAPAPATVAVTAAPSPKTVKAEGRQQTITTTAPGRVQYQDKRLMVMLFDFTSMLVPEQIRAQTAARDFLTTKMGASDMVCIMTFASVLNVNQDFTNDRDRLLEVINAFPIGVASDLATEGGNGDDTTGEDTGAAFSADETEFNIFNTDRKLAALESAAKMLAGLPEKKALLYFSSGVGKQGVENQSQLRSTINAAVRANVSFYPIDARGLVALPPGGDASSAMSKGSGMFSGKGQSDIKNRFNDQQETLTSLAADTGGKAFLDDNDLSTGIKQAQDDVRSYYILGYYSGNDKQDGKFRRVAIKLSNNLQAKLDYRSGYFGTKTFGKFTQADKEQQLQEAIMLGDPVTDLPLAVETDYFRLNKTTYFIPVSVKIPGSEIPLAKKGANEETEFDFIGQVRDSKGKLVGSVRDGIKVKLNVANAEKLTSRSLQYDAGFTLPPGTYLLKLLARENQSGKMGTFETKFIVPDFGLPTPGLHISSVVWGTQRQPVNSAIGTAGSRKKDLAADPLIQDGQKLVPSVTRVFRKDQNLYVYLEVYDPASDPTAKRPDVNAVLTFYRGGKKAFESAPVHLSELAPNRSNALPVQFQVPLAKLPAGKYTCQVNLIDAQAKRFAFPRTEMVLLADRAAAPPAPAK
jgi:VWFA-related protein